MLGRLQETVAEFHRHGLFLYTWGDANNDYASYMAQREAGIGERRAAAPLPGWAGWAGGLAVGRLSCGLVVGPPWLAAAGAFRRRPAGTGVWSPQARRKVPACVVPRVPQAPPRPAPCASPLPPLDRRNHL